MKTCLILMPPHTEIHADLRADLMAWYDRHARVLPWRAPPGTPLPLDPYPIWLSEIMLQQTTVKAVAPYFRKFLALWPNVAALAEASEEDVLVAWAGLGYYSRARNLKRCAEEVVAHHNGRFPVTAAGLRSLPGIGDYTSAAIAAIAFGEPVAVVDGNVERVSLRYLADSTPLPAAKPLVKAFVSDALDRSRPGDFAQAMMDLGATICTPRNPACALCPLRAGCAGLAQGDPVRFPVKAAKADKPLRRGATFVALDDAGRVLLEKRPPNGLLASMSQTPTTGWTARADGETGQSAAPFQARWHDIGVIEHVFTHFRLRLQVHATDGVSPAAAKRDQWWSATDADEALPNVFRKAIDLALNWQKERARD